MVNDHVDWEVEKLIGYHKRGEYNDGKAPVYIQRVMDLPQQVI